MRLARICLLLGTVVLVAAACAGDTGGVLYGTVASRPENAAALHAAGLQAVTYEVYWDRLQPARDAYDEAQLERARLDLATSDFLGLPGEVVHHLPADRGIRSGQPPDDPCSAVRRSSS